MYSNELIEEKCAECVKPICQHQFAFSKHSHKNMEPNTSQFQVCKFSECGFNFNSEEPFSFCLQTVFLIKMFLGILLSLPLSLWFCEAKSSKCNYQIWLKLISIKNIIIFFLSQYISLCDTFCDSLFDLHYSKTSIYSFYDLSTAGAMYVIQETEAPCINISDTKSNHELEKLLDRIKYVARSCKEILDKYQVYEGMFFFFLLS